MQSAYGKFFLSIWGHSRACCLSFLSLFENVCNRNSLSKIGSYWLKYCRSGKILALKYCLCHLDCQEALNSRGMLSDRMKTWAACLIPFQLFFLHTRAEDSVGLISPLKMPERKFIYYIMLMFCNVLFDEWLHVRAALLFWYGNSWINFHLEVSYLNGFYLELLNTYPLDALPETGFVKIRFIRETCKMWQCQKTDCIYFGWLSASSLQLKMQWSWNSSNWTPPPPPLCLQLSLPLFGFCVLKHSWTGQVLLSFNS